MLSRLQLGAIPRPLERLLEEAVRQQLNLPEALGWLCAAEVASKEAAVGGHDDRPFPVRAHPGRIRLRGAALDRSGQVQGSGTYRWVTDGDNVVLLGPPVWAGLRWSGVPVQPLSLTSGARHHP